MTDLDLEEIARVCHEANRALQYVQRVPGIPVAPSWDAFPADERAGVVDGVRHALNGARPEQLHQAWCDAKLAAGWIRGPVKDTAARTHPCLVPYDQLPPDQRRKDALLSAIARVLGDKHQAEERAPQRRPAVGRIVHYVSHGTPVREDGSQAFTRECRAAIVTEVPRRLTAEPYDGCPNGTDGQWIVSLAVLHPKGNSWHEACPLDEGDPRAASSNPAEEHPGGTWHWPEGT